MTTGFIKLNRSNETLELLNDPNAFILLTVIALHPADEQLNVHNLRCGEALIGDRAKCGLTQCQYRTAMKRLGRWGFAAFKPTSCGTIAMLLDHRVYDINDSRGDKPMTNERQPDDKQMTTKKNEKKEKKEKNEEGPHADAWRLAELLFGIDPGEEAGLPKAEPDAVGQADRRRCSKRIAERPSESRRRSAGARGMPSGPTPS